jgi:FkbM family methyltransferase
MQTKSLSRAKALAKAAFRLFGADITRSSSGVDALSQPKAAQNYQANKFQVDIGNEMSWPSRPVAFVLVASNHGTMIINRNDYRINDEKNAYGVGFQILGSSAYDHGEVSCLLKLLSNRRQAYGDGVVAIDCGANCGVHTIEWSRHMFGWGKVIAVEAQEKIYYALCGNLAINNCLNAKAILAAVGEETGEILCPIPDYLRPGSFGSLEMQHKTSNEFIGQDIDYVNNCDKRQQITIDQLDLDRVDLIKIDVEGMEVDVLAGAKATLQKHRPQMFIEWIKSDCKAITSFLETLDYRPVIVGNNIFAAHEADKAGANITTSNGVLEIRTQSVAKN